MLARTIRLVHFAKVRDRLSTVAASYQRPDGRIDQAWTSMTAILRPRLT